MVKINFLSKLSVKKILNLFYFNSYEFTLLVISYFSSVLMEMFLFLLAQRITREKVSYKDFLAVLPQRIIYGVICTFLLYKAALYAFIGVTVLWNKVERKGNNRPLPDQTGASG